MHQNRLVVFVIILLAGLVGCDSPSPLSHEDFTRINSGMSEKEVYDILGEPDETSSLQVGGQAGISAVWKDDRSRITIQFLNDKVQVKQYTHSEDDPVVD